MDVEEMLDEEFDDGSDDAEGEFQYPDDPSPAQPSSGPPSTSNSCTSSPPVANDEPSLHVSTFYSQNGNTLVFGGGKPYGPKRGPGRPRKDYPGMRGAMRDARILFKRCRGGIMRSVPRKKIAGKDVERQLSASGSSVICSSQESGFASLPPKSPSDFINTNCSSSTGAMATTVASQDACILAEFGEKSMQAVEEPPYFPEKWPGKVCALCNLGERSQLGQGEMLRMEITEEDQELFRTNSPDSEDKEAFSNDMNSNSSTFPQFSNRRQKGLNKCKNPVNTSEYVDELEKVGYYEQMEMSQIQDGNHYYIHRNCATWSSGVVRDSSGTLGKIPSVVAQSLRRKCSYCSHYGASVACKMACPKFFHFACVAASGGFQTIQTYVSFCKEHLGQVPIICTDDINCRSCCGLGDVSNLVMCSICGDHYHGTCIGLPQLPGVRAGWQCTSCHKCQICRVPDTNEGRSLSCEQCHKVYHANCLRPIMASIPKYGWKCRRCRVCSDCGSRTPGAGASSRWHAHYTVCDSCYQQRNKGFSCPICHRAYRAAAYKEMVKCSLCNKFVHSTCDSEADLGVYHSRKETNPDYDYVCPPCKTMIQSGRINQAVVRRNSHAADDEMTNSQDSACPDDFESPEAIDRGPDFGLGKGKPYAMKISKKRIGLPFGHLNKARGKLGYGKRSRLSDLGRKRGPKSKMRGIFGVPGLGLQRPMAEANKADDEPGIENRLVLCSAKDKFILTQDICVMCGAIGTDYEGCLMSCTQCGQCYHPYCVNVKVTKVIIKKGWRCLDCTVCEGCGQKNDEARLILCDECDISYHIYCMDPPLDYVPQGNWKCKWCAICQKCGRESPGKNCTWKNSYSECGPCSSQSACAVCNDSYGDGELIIQCAHCERWLHCKCDSIKNEEDADKCDNDTYHCILCRPKDIPPPHLMPVKRISPVPKALLESQPKVDETAESAPQYHGLEGSHLMDGIFLSEQGFNSIKSLQMEYIRKKRKPKASTEITSSSTSTAYSKDAGILASIESVVAGSGTDSLTDDLKVADLLDPKEEAEIYKDGMVWERSDGSPPEGFALCTNEQGVVVLRKKRQRNLQKLGIGGFNVRNRAVKKDKDDYEEHGGDNTAGSTETTPSEKKRKPIRKRPKNKLAETYPAYLQEAFFGKELLLEMPAKPNFESESSDDDTKSSVSEDKTIKLSPDELKVLESMKQENKVESVVQPVGTPSPAMIVVANRSFSTDVKHLKPMQTAVTPLSVNTTGPIVIPAIPPSPCDENDDNADADALKDIIPHDLLDSDLVNSIMNDDGDDLVKSDDLGVQYDSNVVGSRKDDLPDILGPNFNLDSIEINSKDVEEIFHGVINPEPKPFTNIVKQENQVILQNSPFPKTGADVPFMSNGVMEDVKPLILNNFMPVQQPFSNSAGGELKSLEQVHSTSSTPTPSFVNTGNTSSNSPMAFATNQPLQNMWSSNSQSPRQATDFPVIQSDDSVTPTPANQSCTMKSAERMRRDEELGEMATISAVLYANTNHPELKHDYPNWSDRQKQIYKKWRALSNEKKAPYLQQARDNRTALRMRKNQQAADIDKDKNQTDSLGTDSGDLDLTGDQNDEDSTSRMSSCSSSIDNESKLSSATCALSTVYDTKDVDESDSVMMPPIDSKQDMKIEIMKNTTATKVNQSTSTTQSTNVAIRYKLNVIKDHPTTIASKQNSTVKETATAATGATTTITTSPIKRTTSTFPKFFISTNMNGPAPNVTVNANGAFNTNSKSVLHTYCATRPITNHHFLVMNKTPATQAVASRLSVEVPNSAGSTAKDKQQQQHQQLLIRGVVNDPNDPDVRNKLQIGSKKVLHINPSDLIDLNGRKLTATTATTAIGSIYLDQNIRVLTPSEIMKTLPIIPGQDSVQSSSSSVSLSPTSSSSSSTVSALSNYTNRIISGCSLDQEKIATQQKSLKEQEQERQWKQLQAMRAKEQQLQQFNSPVGGQTSPSMLAGNAPPNFMLDQSPIPVGKRSPYGSIPGTPRPTFDTNVITPTVYAMDAYQPPSMSLNSPTQEKLLTVKQQENNKQLRDLLQRQESLGGMMGNTMPISVSPASQQMPPRWPGNDDANTLNPPSQSFNSTFRQPFPVTLQSRNTAKVAGNPNNPAIRMPISGTNVDMPMSAFDPTKMNAAMQNHGENDKKLDVSGDLTNPKTNIMGQVAILQQKMKMVKETVIKSEIPDNVTAELEKFEQEENVAIGEVEGVGDILGGLGEDDDDELLKSLTAEMGADFNILEYADPELDALTGEDNQNLLDKFDFVEGDSELKKSTGEKYVPQRTETAHMERQIIVQQTVQNQVSVNQAPPRYNSTISQPNNMCSMPPRPSLAPPPPPYPGPPPPYPANSKNVRQQDQPLLLEDLLEQEKREQQQQQLSSSMMVGQMTEKKTILVKTDQINRNPNQMMNTWRKDNMDHGAISTIVKGIELQQKKEIISLPVVNFNFQPAPPQPPDNIVTEQDRILQINYEQWLYNQHVALENQLKFFEEKITKIRKIRKSLNSKQRLMKKSGGELPPNDAKELVRITTEQPGIQKQLDSAKKQFRMHGLLLQDYKTKHAQKLQMSSPNLQSPAQMTPQSPMLSPSTNSQPSLLMRTSPSPLSQHMLQSTRSPLQSPSPLLSHSPGGISQSPVHQSNSNPSPYNTIQTSPRIGTPHSQIDENSFSPSATMSSPSSLPGRHASPAPRITSPQHRVTAQMPNRIVTSPGHSFNQMLPQQNSKFNAPHTPHERIRIQVGQHQQQQHHQQQVQHMQQMVMDHPQHQQQTQQQQMQQMVATMQFQQQQQQQQQSSDMMQQQTQRTIHFLQQRQIMQRQPMINQVMNKTKNHHPASSPSPSHISPSPASPLLQCSLQPNSNSNSNNFSVLNSPDTQQQQQQHHYMQQNDAMSSPAEMKNFTRNLSNQDSNSSSASGCGAPGGGGGGISSFTGGFLPYTGGGSVKRGKIRIGLFGGSPMWNISSINQKIGAEKTKSAENSIGQATKSRDIEKDPSIAGGTTAALARSSKSEDDVVVIDSSPDEKQRMMDYDDYQDKGLVATEVSLSSVAQNIGDTDDITVIESFATSELNDIVSSPLEPEVGSEYVLFSSDVVDYADSDDSLKQNITLTVDDVTTKNRNESAFESSKSELKHESIENSINDEKPFEATSSSTSSERKDETMAATTVSQNSVSMKSTTQCQDLKLVVVDSKSKEAQIRVNDAPATVSVASNTHAYITKSQQIVPNSSIMTINRIPFTSVCSLLSGNLTQTTSGTTLKMAPKKGVSDVSTTTTKVSIGNTTISVPILKNVTITSPHILTSSDKQGHRVPTSITVSKQPFILSSRGTKLNPATIVSLSSLQLKPTTKIVQATVVGKKLQLPPSAAAAIVTSTAASTITLAAPPQSSQQQQQHSDNLTNAKQNLIQNIGYQKLSSLTVPQDMSLPTKIFENESTSPENPGDQDEIETVVKKPEANDSLFAKRKESLVAATEESKSTVGSSSSELAPMQKDDLKVDSTQKDPQKLQTRLISIVPQLSPLSQPTEMTTNMANVSQQLRTIMSSLNPTQHEQKTQSENDLKRDSTRIVVESKVVESPVQQQQHQQQQQQQHQQQQHQQQQQQQHQQQQQQQHQQQQQQQQQQQHQQQQSDEQKEVKTTILTSDSSSIPRSINTNTNKVTVLLTNTSGTTPQFQTVLAATDQSKKSKIVLPTSVLAARLPSAIVVTTMPSTTTTTANTSQSSDVNLSIAQHGQDPSKRVMKPLLAHVASAHLKRSKSTDDGIEREKELPAQITATKRYSLEMAPVKTEIPDGSDESYATNQSQTTQTKSTMIQVPTSRHNSSSNDSSFNGCKISNVISQPSKSDDSQNVLLKQLLQNSTSTSNTPTAHQVLGTRKGLRAPSLGLVSSLEAQLARPVIPPVPAAPPNILTTSQQHQNIKSTAGLELQKRSETPPEDSNKKPVQLISRETSFVSNPVAKVMTKAQETALSERSTPPSQPKPNIDAILKTVTATTSITSIKIDNKPLTTMAQRIAITSDSIPSEAKIPSPAIEDSTTKSSLNDSFETSKSDSNSSPSLLKRPNSTSLPFSTSMEANEDVDMAAITSAAVGPTKTGSDKSKSAADLESSIELKKKKKREYQKNRRQMQSLNKEMSTTSFSKKRARKVSKVDGDYDMFIDNLMTQLRQMPPLQVLEPLLNRSYGICPPYGTGDLSKLSKENGSGCGGSGNSPQSDQLYGDYGNLKSTNIIDFYNTKPFGPLDMPSELPNSTIQNGFYDQEFAPIKFETDADDRLDFASRDWDLDTSDSIVTSSSPECTSWEPILPFPGLRVISESDDEMEQPYHRMSPVVPVIAPIPVKLKTGIDLSIDRRIHSNHYNKENNMCNDWKSRNAQQMTPTKDPNVTVTLTLTSSAAEDIMGVLRDLANILHIPAPTSYQIVERTTTPPSQKLGLYRTKGKDGKEGDPIDIQTILNGAAKFCRHCDVVILNTIIRAKASEFPSLASNELLNNSDDLYFCSKSCYKQFKWRPTNIIDDNFNLNSKLNLSLESSHYDGFAETKTTVKVEGDVGGGKNARKASVAGLDDNNFHKTKISKTSHQDSVGVGRNSGQLMATTAAEKVKACDADKRPKNSRYRYYSPNAFGLQPKYKKSTEREITEMLFRMAITVAPVHKMPDDTRQCIFCNQIGDGVADGPSRLLNFDVDKWVHLNCALWSDGVYETENGALMNLEAALQVSLNQTCTLCHNLGATIKCFKNRCSNVYHLTCAVKDNCIFYKNKSTHCMAHVLKNEKENELTTLSVQRRVYVDRDESRQVAAVMHHSELSNLLRVGSLTFLNVGQLLPHQLQAFHTPNYIYPIGYKIIRFYWSMRKPNKRCRYICSIADAAGRPEFRVIVQESSEEDIELRDTTPKAVWQRILEPMATLRKSNDLVQLFPKYVTGEDLFGLTEPAVVRILESLPGIETLTDYRFKYGRNPLLELPLAINPSGAARTEPKQRQTVGWRKPHTQRTGSTNQRIPLAPTISVAGEVACPYSKQFVHSKSSQYKKMKQEWRNNVFLARSKIQGLGLYAARDLEKHTMVIEYIGEVIRTEVSELREKQYESRNRGIYMFRLDEDRVVDATLSGGLARYINHSCNPNCVTEIVEVDREYRIIIFAKRRINRGEELSYDYKFDIEDDAHKISCMCGAPNCRKWMN